MSMTFLAGVGVSRRPQMLFPIKARTNLKADAAKAEDENLGGLKALQGVGANSSDEARILILLLLLLGIAGKDVGGGHGFCLKYE